MEKQLRRIEMKKVKGRRRQVFGIEDQENVPVEGQEAKEGKNESLKEEVRESRNCYVVAEGILTKNFFEKTSEGAQCHYDSLTVVQGKQKQPEQVYEFAVEQEQHQESYLETEQEAPDETYSTARNVYLFDQEASDEDEPTKGQRYVSIPPANEDGNSFTKEATKTNLDNEQEENSIRTPRRLSATGNLQAQPKNSLIINDFGDESQAEQNHLQQYLEQIECIKVVRHIPEGIPLKQYLTKALPKGYVLQCCLRRDVNDLSAPTYSLYINNTYKHIISAKKKMFCATSNYILSTSREDFNSDSVSVLGKCRSNFLGTVFNGYTPGKNPDTAKDKGPIRANIVTVKYQANFLGSNGPRKMELFIPNPMPTGQLDYIRPNSSENCLDSELYRSSVLRFINKPPDWDDNLQAYVLNFNGRVTKASVKNFLMMDEATGKTRMLFGRLAKNVFSLDIEHPFSVLQAMCVVLSSFDRKLACQ